MFCASLILFFYKTEINLSVDSLAITLLQIDFAFDDADAIEEGTFVAMFFAAQLDDNC